MRIRSMALALILAAACGDPIEIGDARHKRLLAEDRKLAEIAGAIEGTWVSTVDLKELLPLPGTEPVPLTLELVLQRDEDGGELARSGTYRTRCVGAICGFKPTLLGLPVGPETLGEALNETGSYQVAALEADGASVAYFRNGDGGPIQIVQVGAKIDRLETAFPVIDMMVFTRGSAP